MTLILNGTDNSATTPAVQGGTAGTTTGVYYPATNQVAISTNGTQAMLVDASQNVGINAAIPGYKLDVAASDTTAGFGYAVRLRTNATAAAVAIQFTDNPVTTQLGALAMDTSSNMKFYTGGTERMRIDGSGNFDFKSGLMTSTGTQNNTTAAGANMFISAGQMYRSTSSLKYKKNVENATHGLVDLLKLRPVTYEGKAEADDGKTFGGLIAEEVHEAGLIEFVQYAEDGSPDALAYGNMVSLCVKAIQELKAEFDAYKASHP